jgi:hypothetical protein
MIRRRNTRWEDMDRSNIDLSVLTRHYEVHNRTKAANRPGPSSGTTRSFRCSMDG